MFTLYFVKHVLFNSHLLIYLSLCVCHTILGQKAIKGKSSYTLVQYIAQSFMKKHYTDKVIHLPIYK